ncbi:MAG: hypothetical protein K8S20_15135 [Chloroflexi bacterium]|nr:hypothetical protein [Chloroflexota bacterium]
MRLCPRGEAERDTCVWAGVDSAGEQEKPEATLREMLKKAAHREAAVPSVQQLAPASVASTGCTLC